MTNEGILLIVILLMAALLLGLIITVVFLIFTHQSPQAQIDIHKQYEEWRAREIETIRSEQSNRLQVELESRYQNWQINEVEKIRKTAEQESIKKAGEQLQQWRSSEIETVRMEQSKIAIAEARLQLQQWQDEQERLIRRDAIQKSQSVTVGKFTEHFVPYLPGFNFNPKDARFIGSPIDLVIFDGLSEGNVKQIVFVEIKTGSSSLSTRERQVREAVLAGKIKWADIHSQTDQQDLHPLDITFPAAKKAISEKISGNYSAPVSDFPDRRVSSSYLDKCPHGIPKIQKCAICDPEGYRSENGW